MEPVVVLSPHLDDAVLSAGQYLAAWPGATVVSVFAGVPPVPQVTTFDVHSEFSNSTDAVIARWHEDDRALRCLDAKPIRLSYLDNQYREGTEGIDVDMIAADICKAVRASGASKLVSPLGLAHVDHEITAIAAMVAYQTLDVEFWMYEEIPAWIQWPELVAGGLERARAQGFDPTLGHLGVGDIEKKRSAVACYASQAWALNSNYLYVPERFWEMKR